MSIESQILEQLIKRDNQICRYFKSLEEIIEKLKVFNSEPRRIEYPPNVLRKRKKLQSSDKKHNHKITSKLKTD